jgi:hypothetical protein
MILTEEFLTADFADFADEVNDLQESSNAFPGIVLIGAERLSSIPNLCHPSSGQSA